MERETVGATSDPTCGSGEDGIVEDTKTNDASEDEEGLTMAVSTTGSMNGHMEDDDDIGEFVEEEEEDKDDNDESEEEEDVEPMVIYERMKNEITAICSQRDAISCFAVHYKVMSLFS